MLIMAASDIQGVEVHPARCVVYVGTYTGAKSQGIYAYTMELASGALTPMGLAVETKNPTFLDVNPVGGLLYAVNELERFEGKAAGAVSAFSADSKSGKLTLL